MCEKSGKDGDQDFRDAGFEVVRFMARLADEGADEAAETGDAGDSGEVPDQLFHAFSLLMISAAYSRAWAIRRYPSDQSSSEEGKGGGWITVTLGSRCQPDS